MGMSPSVSRMLEFPRMTAPLIRLEACASTNTELLRLAESGAEAFTTVVARYQSAGRGRAGHRWTAPAGSALLFSTLLRPRIPVGTLPLASLAVGLALCEAVREETGLPAGLKWPNDLLVRERKCAGILCEGVPPRGDEPPAVVAGIGVNLSIPQEALPPRPIFPATSLSLEGTAPDADRLLERILGALRRWIAALERPDGVAAVVERFGELDALRGRRLRAELPGGESVVGTDSGITPEGALRLETDGGPVDIYAGSLAMATGD